MAISKYRAQRSRTQPQPGTLGAALRGIYGFEFVSFGAETLQLKTWVSADNEGEVIEYNAWQEGQGVPISICSAFDENGLPTAVLSISVVGESRIAIEVAEDTAIVVIGGGQAPLVGIGGFVNAPYRWEAE